MSEPTYRALCCRGAGCLSSVRTYLPDTVLQWCRLFKQCLNLPAGHSVAVVKAVLAMSESTCLALCYSGADCLSESEPTCWALCYSGDSCFSNVRFPAGHCVTVMQAVLAMSEITCRALSCRGADCLSGVRTYLPGTVFQW